MYYIDEVQPIPQRLQCMNNYHTKHSSCRDLTHCYQEGQVMCHTGENSSSNRILINSGDMSFLQMSCHISDADDKKLNEWCWLTHISRPYTYSALQYESIY
jgi:hypothetical protein